MGIVLKRGRLYILVGIVLAALTLAWINRFILDDAFISFLYSRNLVEGKGLTWFGTRVEGYSNFLWVIWIALGMKLGITPVYWSYLGGIVSFAVAIISIWGLANVLFGNIIISVTALLMFVSNYTVFSFATSGLETMLQTALVSACVYLFYRIIIDKITLPFFYVLLSLLMAAAFLTRMDSAVFVFIIMVGTFHIIRRRKLPRHYLYTIIPALSIACLWFAFRYAYYGRLLPNSYYAKVTSSPHLYYTGLLYVVRFFHWYAIWPLLMLGAAVLLYKRQKPGWAISSLALFIVAWLIYIVYVGGDFMEFRFMVPVAPLLFILTAYTAYHLIGEKVFKSGVAGAAFCILVLSGASLYHAKEFKYTEDNTIDGIGTLSTYYGIYHNEYDWSRLGTALKEELGPTGAVLALGPVGAIPFYSGIKTIDIWGLNDLSIPCDGYKSPPLASRPGHRCLARLSYLKEQKANFIIDFPVVIPSGEDLSTIPAQTLVEKVLGIYYNMLDYEPVKDITMVAMPVDGRNFLIMWYFVPSREIDALITKNKWKKIEAISRA